MRSVTHLLAQMGSAPPDDFWRHPLTLVVIGCLLTFLFGLTTGLLWRLLNSQKETRTEVQRIGTELRTHMAREDATNDDVDARIQQMVDSQADVRKEMRAAVAELRGDVRTVHERLDLVLAGAPEARRDLWRRKTDDGAASS